MTKRIALYPGTFDPLTFGHLNIIERASALCDKLVVGVAQNSGKSPIFSLDERLSIISEQIATLQPKGGGSIEAMAFTGLLTRFADSIGAIMIIRGLRAVSDFEYEFQMASMNKRLKPDMETIFLTASENQHFVASSLVKEVARLGGDVTSFVPEKVNQRLLDYFSDNEA
ncbi:MAG TPA: pantetheine-phosphate adenylyltransferase [Alphaproteobacteria bacterium]|nr:pantetheine-phosphate adenylyltransferase [Alphaproteobacteria bacterium]